MNAQPKPGITRAVERAFATLVRLWPADSRDWALAMQAELPEIHNSQESLRWLAGGIMSLGKAWWNELFRGSKAGEKQIAPVKRPGALAGVTLLAALALLLLPSANQGLRAVLTSWQSNRGAAQETEFMRIARKAESRGDAKTMAFAAMRLMSWKDYVSFSNKAVALDPSLTWIFSQGFFGDVYVPESRDWPAKLEAWDPGNGVAYLIQGEIRAAELRNKLNSSMEDRKYDSQWLDAGRKAMESPRFDSYRERRLALEREVIQALGIKDPGVINMTGLRSGWVNISPAWTYSRQLLDEAKTALQRGDKQTAKCDAWVVAHFGETMRAHGGTETQRFTSLGFLRPAYTILQPILAAEGRKDEAAMLSQELETIRQGAPGALPTPWPDSAYMWTKTASVTMNLGTWIAVLLTLALSLSGIWLLAARLDADLQSGALYRVSCGVGRFAPVGLLMSLAALAASYWPTVDAIQTYLDKSASQATVRNMTDAYYSVYWLPERVLHPANSAANHSIFWLFVVVAGIATVLMIIGRNMINRAPRVKAA